MSNSCHWSPYVSKCSPEARELHLIRTDKWAEEVQRDWRRLRKASEAVRNDVELVAAALESSRGEAIKFAGEEMGWDGEEIDGMGGGEMGGWMGRRWEDRRWMERRDEEEMGSEIHLKECKLLRRRRRMNMKLKAAVF